MRLVYASPAQDTTNLLPAKILESCSRSSGPEQEPDAQLRMQAKPEEATWFHCFQSAKLHRRAMATARRILTRRFTGTWRQGQLPSGQTAKARPDYRVQSLHKGHNRVCSIESKHDIEDTQYGCLSSCGQLWSEAKTNAWALQLFAPPGQRDSSVCSGG